ncbi:MAG: cyclase family protein [Ilumatobacteraceae bacterium]
MPLQAASQWDGLAHVFYDDQMYNGFPSSDVGPKGAMHCSIDKMAKGIVGRGVLLDIARLKGVDWLEAGHVITPDDLDAACAAQGVTVGSGDILFFRTGWRTVQAGCGSGRPWRASRVSGWIAMSGCTSERSP